MIPRSWNLADWMVMVAGKVNPILRGYPYPRLDAEPSDVEEGYTFYDLTAHKVKTFDGTNFQAHW